MKVAMMVDIKPFSGCVRIKFATDDGDHCQWVSSEVAREWAYQLEEAAGVADLENEELRGERLRPDTQSESKDQ